MLIRFLFLVLVVGGGFAYFHHIAPTETRDKAFQFVQDLNQNTKDNIEDTTQTLLTKKEELLETLKNLQAQVVDTAEAGVEKYEEVTTKIEETKDAIKQVDESLDALKESIGLGESEEGEQKN